ncbi:RodZ domain-containing protein [Shewanella putrefaciens]|uniref:DUF4115 domain-containing protein n=1 Tax=Shewanella putrefaciens TaxID=24 RepID=A0ABX8X894_SHEPU|nr:RodZ domain-containing protein [Shewanella putrefaciens]AVV85915.1 membrane protein [Shewanella putrefaciens]MCT8944836.1 DUF4115 domain-containing protein [Shewanella putrefaciens]QSE48337.1 DUF4115 domain-containing protein [Shewanella putrefaciens]QYX71742.1 DUF4115 domain-containing protein [Shewanella putrefaciens]GGN30938.1 membrane protein [Shewanella putrefaciens]
MKDHETNASIEVNETETTTPDVTLGNILKNAREEKGLSIADAAVKLHLRPGIVEDLEADNFTNIASPTYVRGYVKNYARMLGIDYAPIEACLAKQVPLVTSPAMQSFSRKTTYQASDTKLKWVSIFIVIVLLGLLVVWWMQKSTLLTTVDVSQPTMEEVAAANLTLPGDVLLTETDVSQGLTDIAVNGSMSIDGPIKDTDANTIDPNPMDTDALESNALTAGNTHSVASSNVGVPATSNQAVVANTPHTNNATGNISTASSSATLPATNAPTAQGTIAVAGQSNLNIQLAGDCWINIVDAQGKVLVDGVRGAGANIQVNGTAPFKVILGAPHVATLSMDGQAVSLADFPKGRVARLTLPKA